MSKINEEYQRFIPEFMIDYCFESNDGMVFTPYITEDKVMLKTGKEVYEEWISLKNNKKKEGA